MRTLIENLSPSYCSKTIMHTFDGRDTRFKIVAECGNSYSRLNIAIQVENGDFNVIAIKEDIPNYRYVNYVWSSIKREDALLENIKAAEDYILKVF